MIFYEKSIKKAVQKGIIPREIINRFHNAFLSLELTGDFQLFDVKRLRGNTTRNYYRLRKGQYRAIFYQEKDNFYVIALGKREEVYRRWE